MLCSVLLTLLRAGVGLGGRRGSGFGLADEGTSLEAAAGPAACDGRCRGRFVGGTLVV